LAKVLSMPETSLESINLGNNNIKKDGALALAKALTLSITIKNI
jgi:hypothetical protein